jgi:hypothetical protein
MIQDLINNPTSDKIDSAYFELNLQGSWAYRQHGEQARAYEGYLEACNDVRLALKQNSPDLHEKIARMNEKKELI